MMSDFVGFARDLARQFVAKAMSGRRGAKNTLAHNASKTSMLFGTRFLVLIVIIVAIHNGSDHSFFILHDGFVHHACHISCSRQLPNGVTVSQIPCTHVRLGGTGSISPTTSYSCELEPTMIKSSTCTTLRAKVHEERWLFVGTCETKPGCEHVSDVFMEESRSVPQTIQSSLESPNRVIVLVETFRRLHVHQIALRHERVHESNTNVTEQKW